MKRTDGDREEGRRRKGREERKVASRPLDALRRRGNESAQAGRQLVDFHTGKQPLSNSEKARVFVFIYIAADIGKTGLVLCCGCSAALR